jgi:hypothetical protein
VLFLPLKKPAETQFFYILFLIIESALFTQKHGAVRHFEKHTRYTHEAFQRAIAYIPRALNHALM